MHKKSIKNITLTSLLKVFFLFVLVISIVVALSYRSFFNFVIENKILSVSEVIKAGLTSHMKAEIMDKRAYFLNEISSVYNIKSIKIIRGDSVSEQFGKSTLGEVKLSEDMRKILNKKELYIKLDDISGSVEAVVPYIATSRGTLNCLECHKANDGDVLGAVNITINIDTYQNFLLKNASVIIIVLFLCIFAIIGNMIHVVERYIRKPLSVIIDEGEQAYVSHENIDSAKYESKEFEDVANNVNKFNHNVLEKEAELEKKNKELQKLNEEIEATLKETMLAVGRIEETRSGETKRHTERVATISIMIAKSYGLNDEEVNFIELASPLHDIGKIGIGDAILSKPDKLTYDEYEVMKTHAVLGYNILKHSEHKILQTAATIAYEHHERYDGTGYPQGLKGKDISIYARIVAIVDVVDALFSKRAYKNEWEIEDIIDLLKEEKGRHFDPDLVDIVLENIEEYRDIIIKLS